MVYRKNRHENVYVADAYAALLPATPSTLQVTPFVGSPVTVALNCTVWLTATMAARTGLMFTATIWVPLPLPEPHPLIPSVAIRQTKAYTIRWER